MANKINIEKIRDIKTRKPNSKRQQKRSNEFIKIITTSKVTDNRDVSSMTKKELAKELYQAYLKTGSMPIGSNKPLSENEYVRRYINGVGGTKGFSKQALQDMVQEARNGKYHGFNISKY